MATTTKTLLEAVNDTLIQIGERTVSSLGSIPAQKARLALEKALGELNVAHDWEWLRDDVQPDTWDGHNCTLSGVSRVFGAYYRAVDSSGTFTNLKFIPQDDFRLLLLADTTEGTPEAFTQFDDSTFGVYPAPGETNQSGVHFRVLKFMEMPQATGDVFNVPDQHVQTLLIARACFHMVVMHLDDQNTAQRYEREWLTAVRITANRENGRPPGSRTFYRRRR